MNTHQVSLWPCSIQARRPARHSHKSWDYYCVGAESSASFEEMRVALALGLARGLARGDFAVSL